MENYAVVIFILAITIGLSAFSEKIRVPTPVLLICGGIAIGFLPALPGMDVRIEINPEIIFLIFLPPLLYDGAFNISMQEFRVNFNTITTLAFGLVFLTAGGIAVIGHYVIGLTWPLAFVLGAILSATDAVAAMSITRGLGLRKATVTILEGESLINDASALVIYRFAIAAATGSAFVFREAGLDFLLLIGGGFLVGLIMGKLLSFVISRTRGNHLATLGFTLLMPFVTYLVAEEFNVSGVIAVVVLGLGISRFSSTVFPESLRKQSEHIWEIILFLLNGLIFILMGLQLPLILNNLALSEVPKLIGYSVVIAIAALALRMLRMLLQRVGLEKAFKSRKRRISEESLLTTEQSVIISWAGMRGIVSLAIALGLPKQLGDGRPFPYREEIIFISVAVVLINIIGQGLTLPRVVRKMTASEEQRLGRKTATPLP